MRQSFVISLFPFAVTSSFGSLTTSHNSSRILIQLAFLSSKTRNFYHLVAGCSSLRYLAPFLSFTEHPRAIYRLVIESFSFIGPVLLTNSTIYSWTEPITSWNEAIKCFYGIFIPIYINVYLTQMRNFSITMRTTVYQNRDMSKQSRTKYMPRDGL